MNSSFKKYASEQYVDEQLGKIHLDWESIQNKPFYEDRSNLVERMTLDSSGWQSSGPIHIYTQYISNDDMIFQPGDQCTVNIDGKDYFGTLTLMTDEKSFVIGDLEKFEAQDLYNIDFLFGFGEATYNRHQMICIFNCGSEIAPNQTIVYSGIPNLKQLDEKFIPETPIDWNRLTNVPYVTNKVICEWEQNKIYDTQVPLGDTGNVTYNFTHLSKISSDSFTLNDLNNKKLRVHILMNQTIVVDETMTIDITQTDNFKILNESCADLEFLIVVFADSYTHPNYNTTLTKGVWVPQDDGLDENYIVKEVQLLDDSEIQIKKEFINTQWDNIQNKPFADGSTEYVYDINNTYNEVINFQDFEVYTKISNNTPTKETFYNQIFSIDYLENDELHHREITLTADNIGELVENTVFGTDGLMIVREPWVTDEELYGEQVVFSPGVWAINVMNGDMFVQHSEVTSIDGNKCILEHYIPDTIARKADLNNIDLSNFYSKSEIDNMEFITVDDIDNICGTTIVNAVGTDVKF